MLPLFSLVLWIIFSIIMISFPLFILYVSIKEHKKEFGDLSRLKKDVWQIAILISFLASYAILTYIVNKYIYFQ